MKEKPKIGGQAVIEGVMIKSDNNYVVSIRKKDKIVTKSENIRKKNSKLSKTPFVRGVVNLADMLVIGTRSLIWSANEQEEKPEEKISKKEIISIISVSFLFAILFFVALPYVLTVLIGVKEESKPLLFNLIDGVIRISLFLLYIWAISFMKDVKELFQYHGAEHKAVNCFEDDKELTIKNVKRYSTLHTRCGTSFIMIVLVISILVFSILPGIIMYLFPDFSSIILWQRKVILFLTRLLMIPVIAGISYEFLKFSDKKKNTKLFCQVTKPGLWLQKITTKEPNTKQLEVAIESVKAILKTEGYKKV